jgi:hypothetical protein
VRDPVLGKLELERDLGWYAGWRRKGKAEYEVTVTTPSPDDEHKVRRWVERARSIVLHVEAHLPSFREAIADELLDVCNLNWRDGERPVSRTAFKRQLTLDSVDVADRRVTIHLACGDLFSGHVVEVRMSPRGKVSEILLAG